MTLPTRPAGAAWAAAALLAAAVLAGCGSAPPRGAGSAGSARWPPADSGRDGPGANPPADLWRVPDAEPRLEPLRSGGPNKPYEVLGQAYVPLQGDAPLVERGLASWYGRKFHGRATATGETYDMYAMTAAHKTMPLPSYARVRNPANGREVVLRVNDRGPFHGDRVIDLSYTAALKLGLLGGVAPVEVERITSEAIRTGSWRPAADPGNARAVALLPEPAGGADDPIAEIARRHAGPQAAPRAGGGPAAAEPPPPWTQAAAAPPLAQAGPAPLAQAGPAPLAPVAVLQRSAGAAAPGWWLQLGAFREREGALGFAQRVAGELEWLAPLLTVFSDTSLHRLQAGPYASRAEAGTAAERLRAALQLAPAIVERR